MSEIDSYVFMFKQLVLTGKKSHLEIKSEAGKAAVHLSVEVDVLHEQRDQPRNGPARQRPREKRAAAHDAAIRAVEHVQREESSATEKVADTAFILDIFSVTF